MPATVGIFAASAPVKKEVCVYMTFEGINTTWKNDHRTWHICHWIFHVPSHSGNQAVFKAFFDSQMMDVNPEKQACWQP